MKVKPFETIIKNFNVPEILSVNYNLEHLEIQYSVDEKEEYLIQFSNPIGFKCLHERDMTDYWVNKDLTNNWIVEIFEGGWLEQETKRAFLSHEMFQIREFLIEGIDDCLTVFTCEEPIIKPIEINE